MCVKHLYNRVCVRVCVCVCVCVCVLKILGPPQSSVHSFQWESLVEHIHDQRHYAFSTQAG